MGNRGVLLYVDLGKLEDEPYRLSKIYDTLMLGDYRELTVQEIAQIGGNV